MAIIKTYVNDGVDRGDGLGASPSTIATAVSWDIALEEDRTLRTEFRRLEAEANGKSLIGVQVKNGSNYPIRVRVDGSTLSEIYIAKKQSEAVIVQNARYIQIYNAGAGTIAASTIVVTVTTGASRVSGAAGLGDIYVTEDFTGTAYEDQVTAADDNAFRLVTSETKIRDVIVYVSGNNALVGDADNQRMPLNVGESLGISWIDLSTLYFKNATGGNNTTITVLGVTV
jgi:hypothetical protein